MRDRFDAHLAQAAGELPPTEDERRALAPFGFCIRYIIIGIALITIRLDHPALHDTLPLAGYLLLYLGLRTLRRENLWYRISWVLAAVSLVRQWAVVLLQATPLRPWLQTVLPPPVSIALFVCELFFYFSFLRGFSASWDRAGCADQKKPIRRAMIWYGIFFALAAVNAQFAFLLGLPLLVCYGWILYTLWRAGQALEALGYTLEGAPVRLSRRTVGLGALALTLIPVLLLSIGFTRLPLDAAPRDPAEQREQAELRDQLLELGFPEAILNDLSPQDLAGFAGTKAVEVAARSGLIQSYPEQKDDGALELMTVIAYQSDGQGRVIHWFRWLEAPSLRMGEGLSCSWYRSPVQTGPASGRLLWEQEGGTMAAPLPQVTDTDIPASTPFSWSSTTACYQVCFPYPLQGDRFRGYLLFDFTAPPGESLLGNLDVYYYHQRALICYPWQTPWAYGTDNSGSFRTYLVLSSVPGRMPAAGQAPQPSYLPVP